jgi:hypothetical protein
MNTTSIQEPEPPSERRSWRSIPILLGFLAGVALAVPVMLLLVGPGTGTPVDTTVPAAIPAVAYASDLPASWDLLGQVEVRSEPDMSAPEVTSLAADSGVESTGRVAIADGTLWREITIPGAATGWVPATSLTQAVQPGTPVDLGIPAEALATADAIAAAALAGDLDTLAELALEGDMPFTASFGSDVTTPTELVGLWETIGSDEVLAAIIGLVGLPNWYETAAQTASGDVVAIFVTPRFMHEPSNAENRRLVEEALGAEYVDRAVADGQYLGWRLGITADGDWRFFVAGD